MDEQNKTENIKKILEVPFVSQNSDEVDDVWKNHSCGIACVKTVLDFMSNEKISIRDLIKEGIDIDAYDYETLGGSWTHDGLIRLLRNHGVLSYSQEYRTIKVINQNPTSVMEPATFEDGAYSEKFLEEGIKKIANQIDENSPSIVSVKKGFNKNQSSHLIVITGYEKSDGALTGFYYNDPDSRDGTEHKNSFVDINKFKEFWRRFAIFQDYSN